jgi:hypothetical protein
MTRTALLAVGAVLGASLGVPASIAATQLTGRDIKNNSLTGKDIRDGSLKASDLANVYTWRANVTSAGQTVSTMAIPANSVVVPVSAEFTSEACNGAPVDNPQAATFQIALIDGAGESLLVQHPVALQPQATGAVSRRLSVTVGGSGCVVTASLVFTFEVQAGATGKIRPFS